MNIVIDKNSDFSHKGGSVAATGVEEKEWSFTRYGSGGQMMIFIPHATHDQNIAVIQSAMVAKDICDRHNAAVLRYQQENERLTEKLAYIARTERECCPEHVGFVEFIQKLQVESQSLREALTPLDELYKRYKQVEHTAVWGGSFEREHGARMELKPIVNQMFDGLLKLMESRAALSSGATK